MTTTISMWLGIAFLGLALVAMLLQAWLWGPQYWDAEKKKSLAPRLWVNVHRAVGFAYVAIYVVMMWNMVPRLWQYQFELPARTIMHAVAAISIGVLLLTKIGIIRFFRHFEEATPKIGFGIMLCTVILAVLSVPYALRAHDISGKTLDPQNIERVERILASLDLQGKPEPKSLVTREAFSHGREILVKKCTPCHDMRTVLVRPRTGNGWHSVTTRMLDKPSIVGEALEERDVPFVTAYLVAITPDLQKSMKQRKETERKRAAMSRNIVKRAVDDSGAVAAPYDANAAKEAFDARCSECHGIEEVEEYGGGTREDWSEVISRMVREEEAEVSSEDAAQISQYLANLYPKK